MANTVPVTNVVPIFPAGNQTALMLKNTGTVTVYLGSTASVNASDYPLGVGSSLIWDAQRPLFAYAIDGLLLVSENSGNLFDAQSIATQIIAGGLAQEIAANIAIKGAPPIDKLVLLQMTALNVVNAGTLYSGDVSGFNSLMIMLLPTSTNATGTADLSVTHQATNPESPLLPRILYTDKVSYYGWSVNQPLILITGVRGDLAHVFLTNSAVMGGGGAHGAKAFVYGSTKSVQQLTYETDCVNNPSVAGTIALGAGQPRIGGLWTITGTTTATQRCSIPHRAGRHKLQITGLALSATASTFRLIDVRTNRPSSNVLSIASNTSGSLDVVLAPTTCTIEYKIAAGTAFNLSLIPF